MSFNGTEGAPIALATAAQWTANYRNAAGTGVIKAHFFGRDILEKILAQDGCMGIRMYYAINDEGVQQLILVGADAHEKDQVDGTVADFSIPCPSRCDTSSSLF
ncbi:MAG: hypothetical protein EAY81_04950 [Bacteroidetes bacterium]|nr:MAG: hypothetical protein EAY81_04950 [Bacteroidota bacterium]